MQDKKVTGFFIEYIVVIVILGSLSAIAIPHVIGFVGKGKIESYASEFHNIQTAVVEMLAESDAGTLKPVGPTADMSKVQTDATPPLVLTDYLLGLGGTSIESGCTYIFNADGTVSQLKP